MTSRLALALALSLGVLCGISEGARLPGARGHISKKHDSGHSRDNGLTPEAAADAILALPGFNNPQLPSRHFCKWGAYVL
jgi:hypothetical protein